MELHLNPSVFGEQKMEEREKAVMKGSNRREQGRQSDMRITHYSIWFAFGAVWFTLFSSNYMDFFCMRVFFNTLLLYIYCYV